MKSITILKNGEVIQTCSSIQEAGKWLQQYTGDRYRRFAKIENGYCFDEHWDFNGARYSFVSDEKHRNARRKQLNKQKTILENASDKEDKFQQKKRINGISGG